MQRCFLFFLVAVLGVAMVDETSAQIYPPRSGVPLPSGYWERMETDRTAFRFSRAWKAETDRVREQRRDWERGNLSIEAAPAVSGTKRVPILAARYSNSAAVAYNIGSLQNRLFDGPDGTVTDYYHEISYGNITLTGDVIGSGSNLFRLPRADTYYEGPDGCNGLCNDANTGEFLQAMLKGTDSQVDFGIYDNDGPDGLPNSGDDDGFVDFVAFVHPEFGGECGGSNIWSHRWVYEGWWGTPYETNDDAAGGGKIRVSDYTIQPLISCDGTSLIEIGVYAHEFGHAFGLPDLYDTNPGDGDSQGIGNWGLMASGSWGGDGAHPDSPSHMCAWSKEQLGWVNPTTICSATDLDLAPVLSSGEVYRIYPHGAVDTEYFLLEYRTQEGFDVFLPTAGLAVWHIDNDNPGNGNENKKQVDLEEADGRFDLDQATNRGDAGDVYPGSSSNRTFNRRSKPNSRANTGAPTEIALTGIDFGGSGMTVSVELTECRLGLQGLSVNDTEWGDNTRNLGKSELVELSVCVSNDFDFPRNEISIEVTTASEKVSLLTHEAELGTVALGMPRCATFWLEADSTVADGEQIDFAVFLSSSDGYASTHVTSLFAGQYVLIVEDNGEAGHVLDYKGAVSNAGYTPVVHDTQKRPSPSVGALQGALATVWFTGHDSFTTLKADEQEVVKAFLGGGGALMLSGDDIGFDLVQDGTGSDRRFYETWLKARFVTDVADIRTLNGVAGDPIGDGITYELNAIKSQWPSVIEPISGSFPVLEYAGGGVGSVRYEGDYNLFYTAFNFEAGPPTERNQMMERFLNRYILEDRAAPSLEITSSMASVYSACDSITVIWSASDESDVSEVEVFLYDAGELVGSLTLLEDDPGSFTWRPHYLGTELAFKVVARDPSGLQRVRLTDVFEIQDTDDPVVTVVFPNGGENLDPGSSVEVAWTQADCSGIAGATVSVSRDQGETWEVIGVTEGDNHLTWELPGESENNLLVRVEVTDLAGKTARDQSDGAFHLGLEDAFAGATRAVLLQNEPNPFETDTTVLFFLPKRGRVAFSVYDISGRLVREIFEGDVDEGQHEMTWDGLTEHGVEAPTGVYFMVLKSGTGNQVRKMVRL